MKRRHLHVVGGTVNWSNHYGKEYGGSSKKLKLDLSQDPAIPLITALLKIAKTWKQPKCPSMNEWVKKMWYIYNMEYYSVMRKENVLLLVTT